MDVRLAVTVDHDQQEPGGTHSQCDEPLFILRIPVFTRQGMVVSENRRCFTKGHTMGGRLAATLAGFQAILIVKAYGQMSSLSIFKVTLPTKPCGFSLDDETSPGAQPLCGLSYVNLFITAC